MAKNIEVRILGDTSQFDRSMRKAAQSTTVFSSSLKKMAGLAAASIGFVGIERGLKSVIGAAEQAETSQAKLNVALKNSGLAASQYSKQLETLRAAGRNLGFTNAETNSAMARLVTATGSVAKASKDLAVAQDLARFKGADLGTATQMLTSALGGNVRAIKQLGIAYIPTTTAVDALKRTHVDLTTVQGRALLAQAKLIDKQQNAGAIIDLVSQKVKGQATAFGQTGAGALARFHAQVQNLEEVMGQALMPAIIKVVGALSKWLSNSQNVEKVQNVVKTTVSTLTTVIQTAYRWANNIAKAFGGWKTVLEGLIALKFASWAAAVVRGLSGAGGIAGAAGKASSATGKMGLLGNLTLLTANPWVITLTVVGIPAAIAAFQRLKEAMFGGHLTDSDLKRYKKQGIDIHPNMTAADWKRAQDQWYRNQGLTPPGPSPSAGRPLLGRSGTAGIDTGRKGAAPKSTAPPPATQEQRLLDFAKMLLGSPYAYGQMSKAGVDCSGLVAWAYQKLGISLPHSTYAQVGMGKFVTGGRGGMSAQQMARLRPGDVIFVNYGEGGKAGPGHEALYVGGGRVEVAQHTGTRVGYQSVADLIGGGAFSVRRFLGNLAPGEGYDPGKYSALTGATRKRKAGPSLFDQILPPKMQAQLLRAQTRVETAKGLPQQIAAERAYIAELEKVKAHLDAEHATGAKLTALERERLAIAKQLKGAHADLKKELEAQRQAQIYAKDVKLLAPYGGVSGPTQTAKLKAELAQIEKQVKGGMSGINTRTRQELNVIRRILSQDWIPPAVKARIGTMLDGIRDTFTSHIAAIKNAAAQVKTAFDAFSSNVISAFDAISSQWQSPAAKKLQEMQAQDAMESAQKAYADAVSQYGADSPEAKDAARALEEAKLSAQAQAEQEAHDKKVKADKDALEKQLAALEKEATGAKTTAQLKKIQGKINALLAKYGITPSAVQTALDWSASQTLFVQSMGDLVSSLDALTIALGGKPPKRGGGGGTTGAGAPGTTTGPTGPTVPVGPGTAQAIMGLIGGLNATIVSLVGAINTWNTTLAQLRLVLPDNSLIGALKDGIGALTAAVKEWNTKAASLPANPWASTPPPTPWTGQTGGVAGSGSGDIIPAMLEPGEYVLRKAVVARLGRAYLDRLNRGRIRGFQAGGFPETSAVMPPWANPVAFAYWKAQVGSVKLAKKEARIAAMAALTNPMSLPTPNSAAITLINTWLEALSTDPFVSGLLRQLEAGLNEWGRSRASLAISPSRLAFLASGAGAGRQRALNYGLDVPRAALGGIVRARPGGTLIRVGEGGRDEAIVPLGGGSRDVEFHIYIDGEKVEKVVTNRQLRRARNGGPGLPGPAT